MRFKPCQEEILQARKALITGRLSDILRPVRDLTSTQRTILAAIERALAAGPAPTVRELADVLRMKRSTVHYHLQALRRAGYLTGEGRHRDVMLTGAAREISGKSGTRAVVADAEPVIPIVGSVAAGQPILAAEHLAGTLSLGGLFDRKGPLFALQVAGDSMIGDGIFEGDYAIVRQQANASPGDVVVAMIEDGDASEATIKRYREDRGTIVLEPSNPSYEPLRFAGPARGRLRILGKLVGVLRKV
jgi:repressor LexA